MLARIPGKIQNRGEKKKTFEGQLALFSFLRGRFSDEKRECLKEEVS
jgi:hypothetical protein